MSFQVNRHAVRTDFKIIYQNVLEALAPNFTFNRLGVCSLNSYKRDQNMHQKFTLRVVVRDV